MSDSKTYQQMRRDFQELFFKKLEPFLAQYESERKKQLCKAYILASPLGVAGLFFLCFLFKERGAVKVALFFFTLSYLTWRSIKKRFEKDIKKKIMDSVCSCFGNLQWISEPYVEDKFFQNINLIRTYDSSSYDDIFKGEYNGVNYEIIESKFIRGKNSVFDGVIVKLDMNKPFKGNTVIYPETSMHLSPSSKLVHTELEDTVFNQKFDVFTDNEVEARYLITPSFMERIKRMRIAFYADKVACSFYHKYLYIALYTTRDLFSLCSLTKPVNDARQFFTMYEEIISIIKLIDHFKLDQKIGM